MPSYTIGWDLYEQEIPNSIIYNVEYYHIAQRVAAATEKCHQFGIVKYKL